MKTALLALVLLADVRSSYFRMNFDAVVAEVKATASAPVADRALYVAALNRIPSPGRAREEAQKLREQHPDEAWTWYAVATVTDDPAEKLAATDRMMQLAGERPDPEMIRMRARALDEAGRRADALALLDRQEKPAHMLVTRGVLLRDGAILEQARRLDPDNVEALHASASFLMQGNKHGDALPLLERAATLTDAMRVHRDHWRALKTVKRDQLEPTINAVLERTPAPALLLAAAMELGDPKKQELFDRLLAEAPKSVYAQWALNDRVNTAKDDVLKRAREFVAYPHHADSYLRAVAHQSLFNAASRDQSATNDELLAAIRGMREVGDQFPTTLYGAAPIALAERKLALEEAEALAREGLPAVERHLERLRARNGQNFEELAASQRATIHDALGWVLFHRGKLKEAEKELRAAWDLVHTVPQYAYHLGRVYEAQKKLAKAEELYRKGILMQSTRKNPNADALKAVYKQRYGSLAGWDEYLASAKSKESEVRKKAILEARLKKTTPPFSLRTLDGKIVTHDDLKGKITVVNFWGIWCGWCVREMPELQELAKKYAKDERVAILTINNDGDAEKVRKWMREQKYDFPVLLDDNYVRDRINAFPTTWFIDPNGNIAYEQRGWSERLIEEFSWRIEALR